MGMKQALKASTKAVYQFNANIGKIGDEIGFELQLAHEQFSRSMSNALHNAVASLKTEKQREKEELQAIRRLHDRLSEEQKERIDSFAKASAKAMKAWHKSYNLKNFQENMQKLRETKR